MKPGALETAAFAARKLRAQLGERRLPFGHQPLLDGARIEIVPGRGHRRDLRKSDAWVVGVLGIGELHLQGPPAAESRDERIPIGEERLR